MIRALALAVAFLAALSAPTCGRRVAGPALRPDSAVTISLERTACLGSCPSYKVTVSTTGIVFEGKRYVVALGKYTGKVEANVVRQLAENFLAADFYSLHDEYRVPVTDLPTYILSIVIDAHRKAVVDYGGFWPVTPWVVIGLEKEVDRVAQTEPWIRGGSGLVRALQAEHFDSRSDQAQVLVKQAASLGKIETVRELLQAGVPLTPPKGSGTAPFTGVGWLAAADRQPEMLRVFMSAGASKYDQSDKDSALAGAAQAGDLEAVRALIAYGANPDARLSSCATNVVICPGTVLIAAARSSKPEMVREILRYHPAADARDARGRTALHAALFWAECVRLLADAGVDVNARDEDGDTPLHVLRQADVVEELLKRGADVNARNNWGEAPIFHALTGDVMRVMIRHGADLTIRDKRGETALDFATKVGLEQDLRKAIREAR
ncbi:MAG: ankyrin repeat domain-containing protein [Bryobacteraceae bacterium]